MAPEVPEPEVDVTRANAARMYDYLLGGAHNFAVDRDHAAKLLAANPESGELARANRAFLGRVVRRCAGWGIDQYLDLGSGVPTAGNVHEVAQAILPSARVAYVDNEPVAAAHGAELVAGLDTVTSTRADLREPDAVLGADGVAGLLDLRRPVALLAVSCLHFAHGDIRPIMDRYRARLAPGSVLAISHVSDDVDDAEAATRVRAMTDAFAGSASQPVLRDRREIAALLGDFEPVDPGVVDIGAWPEPVPGARPSGFYAAVGTAPRPSGGA